jgi:protocatechuate 3,4-dioxygenase beta subunit
VAPNGFSPSPQDQGADDAVDSDADPVTGRTGVRMLMQGQNDPTNDAGFFRPASLGDFVFEDLDADGIQDPTESGIPGVIVRLLDGTGNPTGQTASTDANGGYSFDNLTPGDYIVEFVRPNGFSSSPADQGSDDTTDSDADPNTGRTGIVSLESGENDPTNDAGFFRADASLGDFLFEDKNANGIQDGNDTPIPGVTVNLLDASGTPTGQTTTTDLNGLYQFVNLAPGTYIVEFVKPMGFEASPANQGGDDTADSDADPVTGRTGQRTLISGQNDPTNDAGFFRLASLGDLVFEDLDGDGIQDAGEPGIPNVPVALLDGNGNPTGQTTTTLADGSYSFTGLTPGDYIVDFSTPTGFSPAPQNQGGDDAVDSDADPTNGQTGVISLESGENDPTNDAGFFQSTASLGDFVFLDKDADGIQDNMDDPLQGVTVNLLTGGGMPTGQSTTTNAAGFYQFTNLAPGSYIVEFVAPNGFFASPQDQGADDALDSDADPNTGRTGIRSLVTGQNDSTNDAGFFELASLGDFVFEDIDADGIQDAGEPGIPGVTVTLLDENGRPTGATTTTNFSGFYSFTNLVPGTYVVEFSEPANFGPSPANQGGDDTADSDADPNTGRTGLIMLESGENDTTNDAGFIRDASLGDLVFQDNNQNGIQDAGESGVPGVTVTLLDGAGNSTGLTELTDASGNYLFPNLTPGDYIVEFSNIPAGFVFSRQDQGTDDDLDSDADPFTGRTGVINLSPGENDLSNDAGVHPCTFTASITADDITCDNPSTSLVVTTDAFLPTYSWSGPGGFASTMASPSVSVPGVYNLTVTDSANGCTATTSVTVNKNTTIPLAVANNNGPITCAQITATLDGAGSQTGNNISYQWSRVSGTGNFIGATNNITAIVDGPGVYRLLVTNTISGCQDSAVTTVAEDITPPNPVASNDGPFTCAKTSVQVTVTVSTGGLAFSWSGPGGFTANTQSANVTDPGVYVVTVTNPFNGCSATDTTIVTENKAVPENVTATGATIDCANPVVQITASTTTPGVTYSWTGPGQFSQAGQNQMVSLAGNYIVTVRRDDNGCTATATAVVGQNTTTPTASAVGGTLTCNNPTVTLLALTNINNATFSWAGPNGFSSNDQNPIATTMGGYTVTITDPTNGCSNTASAIVMGSILPVINATGGQLTCAQPTLQLTSVSTASSPTYSWIGPNFVSNNQNPTISVPGTYIVTVVDGTTGCAASTSVIVTQDIAQPNVSVTNGTIDCLNGSTQLVVTTDASNPTYMWAGPQAVPGVFNPTVSTPGFYTVTVTDGNTGCRNSANARVFDLRTPPVVNATGGAITCDSTTVMLTVSTNAANPSFQWTGPGLNSTLASPTVSQGGSYTVTVTDQTSGCTATAVALVTEDDTPPSVTATGAQITCLNPDVILNVTTNARIPGYSWSGPADFSSTSPSPKVSVPGTYTVIVVDSVSGCTNTGVAAVTQATGLPLVFAQGGNVTCSQPSIQLQANSTATNPSFEWSGPGGFTSNSPSPSVGAVGAYVVKVTDQVTGCTGVGVANVTKDTSVPDATAIGGSITCINSSVQLQAFTTTGLNPSFNWVGPNGPISGQFPTVSTPGFYIVTITDGVSGCTATAHAKVENDTTPPIASATGGILSCTVPTITLTSTTDASFPLYQWTGPSGFLSNLANPVATMAGTYNLTITDLKNGCSSNTSTTVIRNGTAPTVNATGGPITCANPLVTLNVFTNASNPSYQWFGRMGAFSNGSDTINNPTVEVAGLYFVQVTDRVTGCAVSAIAQVTDTRTDFDVTGTGGVIDCNNQFVSLSVTTNAVSPLYTWTGPNGLVLNQQNPITVIPGMYSVCVFDMATGCEFCDTVMVQLDITPPNVTVADAELTCANPSVALTVTTDVVNPTYQWAGPDNFSSTQASPVVSKAGSYTVTVTNPVNGCSTTELVTVTEDKNPPVAIATNDGPITCIKTSVSLDGTGSSAGVNFTYQWVKLSGAGSLVGPTDQITATVNGPGDFQLTVTDTTNGCQETAMTTVTQDIVPPVASTSANGPVCEGDAIQLIGLPTGLQYSWTGPANFSSNMRTRLITNATAANAGTYTLTVTDPSNGCTDTDQVSVVVEPKGSLSDFVFEDRNANGTQDAGEPGIANVTVKLYDDSNADGTPDLLIATTTTDGLGIYTFNDVCPGNYVLEFDSPTNFVGTNQLNNANKDATDSDADPITGFTGSIPLAAGENDDSNDAGFYRLASLGDLVFEDLDADGIQDPNEPGIGNVTVRLFDDNNNLVGSTTTNANGAYGFANLEPGDYVVEFVAPNGFDPSPANAGGDDALDSDADPNTGRTATINLESGENDLTNDAGFFRSVAQLGDFVFEDKNANGIQDPSDSPIQGVTVRLLDGAGNPTGQTDITDAAGFYQFDNLAPGDYIVEFVAPAGFTFSPADQGGNDTTDSDASTTTGRTGVRTLVSGQNDPTNDAGLFRPAALGDVLFNDLDADGIQDPGEPGIQGVTVILLDGNGQPTGQTDLTDASGVYGFNNLTPGDYIVDFITPSGFTGSPADQGSDDALDSDANPVTGLTGTISLESGETDNTNDAGFFQSNASLGDFVFEDLDADGIQDAGESGIRGVFVRLLDGNGLPTGQSTLTNPLGFYEFNNLPPGDYIVEFVTPSSFAPSPANQGGDDTADSDADPNTGRTGVRSLVSGQNDPTNDAGFFRPAALGDLVFEDADGDGVQDAGETGIPNVTVVLLNGNGSPTGQSTTTDANGIYSFTNLMPGDYIVDFTTPSGFNPSPANQGGDDTRDSDANPTNGQTGVITLTSGQTDNTNDAGFFQNRASLGDFVWSDNDGDGVQDPGEPGIPNVFVTLYNGGINVIIGVTQTDANGFYQFTNLNPGDYVVEFSAPAGFTSSPQDQGGNDQLDSDANTTNGRTAIVNLSANENDTSIDAGFVPNDVCIGDFAFEDKNGNGVQDPTEPGVSGVTAMVYTCDGNVGNNPTPGSGTFVGQDITDVNGIYQVCLKPGDYYVVFSGLGTGGSFVVPNAGNPAIDSDANGNGGTVCFTVPPNSPPIDSIDVGIKFPASLGDFVFEDRNSNGIQDNGEPGIPGVSVTLLDGAGQPTGQSTTTNGAGFYQFLNLDPGNYIVSFVTPTGFTNSPQDQGGDDTRDSDVNPATGRSQVVNLESRENDPTIDAGFVPDDVCIGDFAFEDKNGNGIQDPGEPGVSGVTAMVYTCTGNVGSNPTPGSGTFVGQDVTDVNGIYQVCLKPGDYYVVFSGIGTGGSFVVPNAGNPALDSDANANGGTVYFTVPPNSPPIDSIDVGIKFPASLGDFVFEDIDADGVQDVNEPGIPNVTVTLLDGNGQPTGQSTTTNGAGFYQFTNLEPGTYILAFTTPTGFTTSPADQGGDDTRDSDANPATGRSPQVTLESGDNNNVSFG